MDEVSDEFFTVLPTYYLASEQQTTYHDIASQHTTLSKRANLTSDATDRAGVGETYPSLIISDYLGSGKTTLVNHLLRHADGKKLAILINEFSELPIDADLIEAEEAESLFI